jgi:hypothetical protein
LSRFPTPSTFLLLHLLGFSNFSFSSSHKVKTWVISSYNLTVTEFIVSYMSQQDPNMFQYTKTSNSDPIQSYDMRSSKIRYRIKEAISVTARMARDPVGPSLGTSMAQEAGEAAARNRRRRAAARAFGAQVAAGLQLVGSSLGTAMAEEAGEATPRARRQRAAAARAVVCFPPRFAAGLQLLVVDGEVGEVERRRAGMGGECCVGSA